MKTRILGIVLIICCLVSGCQKSKPDSDKVVATIGDEQITLREFNFYLDSVKQQMQGTELSSDEDWQTKDINGKKAIDVAKERALNIAGTNIAYIKLYELLGHEIDDTSKEQIKKTKDDIVSQYDKNGGYDKWLTDSGITDEFVDMLCKSMYCSDVLFEDFKKDDKEPSEEEIKSFFEDNYDQYFAPYRRAKHILIMTKNMETGEEYSEEEKADAKTKADEIYKKALSGADFDSLASTYSQDPGSKSNPDGYTFTDGEMVAEFQNCVDSLSTGEIGFCESEYGYHIIERLDLDFKYFKDGIINHIQGNKFNDYINEKMGEYGLVVEETEELDKALSAE